MADLHLVKDNDVNVLYHTPSSQFFDVTDNLYNKMMLYLNNEGAEPDAQVKEVTDFLSEQPVMNKRKPAKSERLTRIAFLSTQRCNLRCRYCFANYGNYAEEEDMDMSIDVYRDTWNFMLKKYPKGIQLVQFFGGEPLLGFKEIKEFVPFCLEDCAKRGIKPPAFGVVTNGTIFTEEIVEFFNEYDLPVTISLDGPKELNDVCRISPTGWSVYDKIAKNVKWVNEKRTFPLLVEVTLNKQHILAYEPGKPKEWMKQLHEMGFDGGVIGVVESGDEMLELSDDYEETYKKMYREITDYWFNHLYGDNAFCNFDILRMIKTLTLKEARPLPCGAGLNNITVTAKGEVLPCYILYGYDQYAMGHIQDQDDEKFNRVRDFFMDIEPYVPEECKSCWMRNICNIWCRAFGLTSRDNIATISNPRCWTAEALAEAVMINLTRVKRDPEEYKKFLTGVMHFNDKYKGD